MEEFNKQRLREDAEFFQGQATEAQRELSLIAGRLKYLDTIPFRVAIVLNKGYGCPHMQSDWYPNYCNRDCASCRDSYYDCDLDVYSIPEGIAIKREDLRYDTGQYERMGSINLGDTHNKTKIKKHIDKLILEYRNFKPLVYA